MTDIKGDNDPQNPLDRGTNGISPIAPEQKTFDSDAFLEKLNNLNITPETLTSENIDQEKIMELALEIPKDVTKKALIETGRMNEEQADEIVANMEAARSKKNEGEEEIPLSEEEKIKEKEFYDEGMGIANELIAARDNSPDGKHIENTPHNEALLGRGQSWMQRFSQMDKKTVLAGALLALIVIILVGVQLGSKVVGSAAGGGGRS